MSFFFKLGKTTEDLLATWRREADFVMSARAKDGFPIELYKVASERKVCNFITLYSVFSVLQCCNFVIWVCLSFLYFSYQKTSIFFQDFLLWLFSLKHDCFCFQVHCFLQVDDPARLDQMVYQLPIIRENGQNVTLECRAIQYLNDYCQRIMSESL